MDTRSALWVMTALLPVASGLLGGCSTGPSRAAATTRPGRGIAAFLSPARQPAELSAPPRRTGIPVVPKSFSMLQDGLHNCGSVSMLESWARLHPREAASLVWRQRDRSYLVWFAGQDPVAVTSRDLKQARKVRVIRPRVNDPWAEVILTALTRLKSGSGPLNFKKIEWADAREMGSCLAGGGCATFEIKPGSPGRQCGPPAPLASVDEQLRAARGNPAVATTNSYIHIWSILG